MRRTKMRPGGRLTARTALAATLAASIGGLVGLEAQAQTPTPGPAPAPPRAIRPTLNCQSDAGATADFNGDGADDVAVGAPFDDIFRNQDAGSLNVVLGGGSGLDTTSDVLFSPASGGLPAFKWLFGPGRLWAKSLAAGDFNADGESDLAVGAPGAPVDGKPNTGAVFVLYGDAEDGIVTKFSQVFHQDRGGMPGVNETGDSWGWTVAAADFNGDGIHDLAVGAPGEDIGRTRDAGAVTVVYGKPGARSAGGGLTSTGVVSAQLFIQGIGGVGEVSEAGDMWSLALAPGNFNGDSIGGNPIMDLAVGAPNEDIGRSADTGAVIVLYSASAGLTSAHQIWHQDVASVEGRNEPGDLYGCALAAGNFNGDARPGAGIDDLAVGVPGEDISVTNQGGVNVLYGRSDGGGLSALTGPGGGNDDPGDQYFFEHPGFADFDPVETAAANERFGQALNAQNIDPIEREGPPPVIDPAWELVIGAPGEDKGVGEVFVIGGVRGDGLRDLAANSYRLSQNTNGTHRAGEVGDEFGATLAFGDFDESDEVDLVGGAPGDSTCGAIHETAEMISLGPSLAAIGGDQIARAGTGLVLYGDGAEIGANNGPIPAIVGLGNSSLTRCDYIVDQTTVYGLVGDPLPNAELGHSLAGG